MTYINSHSNPLFGQYMDREISDSIQYPMLRKNTRLQETPELSRIIDELDIARFLDNNDESKKPENLLDELISYFGHDPEYLVESYKKFLEQYQPETKIRKFDDLLDIYSSKDRWHVLLILYFSSSDESATEQILLEQLVYFIKGEEPEIMHSLSGVDVEFMRSYQKKLQKLFDNLPDDYLVEFIKTVNGAADLFSLSIDRLEKVTPCLGDEGARFMIQLAKIYVQNKEFEQLAESAPQFAQQLTQENPFQQVFRHLSQFDLKRVIKDDSIFDDPNKLLSIVQIIDMDLDDEEPDRIEKTDEEASETHEESSATSEESSEIHEESSDIDEESSGTSEESSKSDKLLSKILIANNEVDVIKKQPEETADTSTSSSTSTKDNNNELSDSTNIEYLKNARNFLDYLDISYLETDNVSHLHKLLNDMKKQYRSLDVSLNRQDVTTDPTAQEQELIQVAISRYRQKRKKIERRGGDYILSQLLDFPEPSFSKLLEIALELSSRLSITIPTRQQQDSLDYLLDMEKHVLSDSLVSQLDELYKQIKDTILNTYVLTSIKKWNTTINLDENLGQFDLQKLKNPWTGETDLHPYQTVKINDTYVNFRELLNRIKKTQRSFRKDFDWRDWPKLSMPAISPSATRDVLEKLKELKIFDYLWGAQANPRLQSDFYKQTTH